MRRLIVASALVIAATGFAGTAETKHSAAAPASQVKQVNQHFRDARDAFKDDKFDAASRDIRAGADLVRREATEASGSAKTDLQASARDLDQLASRVEKKSVKDVDELNRAFARADNRLAEHYQKLASESWKQKQESRAGHALDTASSYFSEAASWTGEKAGDVADTARTVSGKLVQGAGWVPEEVGDAISSLGNGIQDLGKKIEPRSSTAGTRGHPDEDAD
jgi:hypothetical protein